MGLLAAIALVYSLLVGGPCWLVSRWRRREIFRTLWLSIVLSLIAVVITIPLFHGIAGLFRYDPPGSILSGMGRYREDWQVYSSAARIVFFVLYGLLVASGGVVGYVRARQVHQGKTVGIGTALGVLIYLMISMPIADFANACIIGEPFLLPVAC